MANARTKWMQEVVANVLDCDASDLSNCFDSNKSAVAEWLKAGAAESRMYFFSSPSGGERVSLSSQSPSLSAGGECVYFLRTHSKAIAVKTRSDGNLLWGTLSKGSLVPVLESAISSVFCPAIAVSSEWDRIGDGESSRGSLLKKGGAFCESLVTAMVNLDDGIELPLPDDAALQSLEPGDNFDALLENKAAMATLRQTVVHWVENIHRFIDEDTSYRLHRSDEMRGGPKEEINWWSKRNLVLTKSQQTLSLSAYRGLIAALQQDAEEEAERCGTALPSGTPHIDDAGDIDDGIAPNADSSVLGTPSSDHGIRQSGR